MMLMIVHIHPRLALALLGASVLLLIGGGLLLLA